jgi:acetyl esterase
MSARSKYPSKKVLIPTVLTAAAALLIGLGNSSLSAGQATNNSSIQNNVGISTPQPTSPPNASDYFVLQSQQELFNAVKSGQAEEIFAKIRQAASEIKMTSITDYNISGTERSNNNTIRVRFYDPGVPSKPSPLLIYLYGRAGEEINMDFSDPGLRILANSTGFMVATMDYRFTPFSDSLDDIIATVRWIRQNSDELGVDSDKIALGGVSRGANLALSTALVLRDSGNIEEQNLIRVLYFLSGYYSPDLLESKSAKMFGNGTDLITSEDIKMIFDQIYQNKSDYSNPLAFPILSKNLTGLPPVYIVASGIDPIKDESIELAARLQEEGQEYYLSVWPGVGHSTGSFIFIPVIHETQAYLDSMTVYLRGVLTENKEN